MTETEEENSSDNHNNNHNSREQPSPEELPVTMTMDLDLDGSWTFDQIFSSDPSPSFFISASDQPFSPLWAFSDDNNTNNNGGESKLAGNATLTPAGAAIRLLSSNPDQLISKPYNSDEKRRLPMPVFGWTPSDYQDATCVIKERLALALRYFKESSGQHILAQVWAPVKKGNRYVLTTSGQPFVLDPNSTGLHQYRMASLMYMFSVDGEADEALGLPGRVFRQKLPEWTPNVQYYSDKEYPRLNHALSYNVRGTLGLPVFEPSGQSCVGVVELILTSQKINYAPEVDKVCKALEAVNLKTSDILDYPTTQICNESRQHALAEILEILTVVCETHKFPLAQTWVPCRHRSVLVHGGGLKKSCSSFDGSCMGQICMSTTDVAFYVVDAHMWGFREACAEHHLQKGQGVAGKAFETRSSCFCENITHFCKTEYPLVHYARMFGLVSSFAISLRSTHTGDDDYVLEFFLPPNVVDCVDQQRMLGSALTTMKQHCRSLKVASGEKISEDSRSVEIMKASVSGDKLDSRIELIRLSEPVISNGGQLVHVDSLEQPRAVESDTLNGTVGKSENKEVGKKSERKRGKAEKSISLDVLQQHFAGSLKDAAKSLGVCPTTMKRICRQHGISRWPSRKINKVNRSLTKLKRVIESVQGAEGAFALPSLATTKIPLAVDSTSKPAALNGSPTNRQHNQQHSPGFKQYELPGLNNEQGPGHQTSGSTETSTGSPASHASSQGSPNVEIESSSPNQHQSLSPPNEQCVKIVESRPVKEPNLLQTEEPFGGMLIEDAGSSHGLKNFCPATSALLGVRVGDVAPEMHNFTDRAEMKTITIKATYREDIIRFRVAENSGIIPLKEEVAKRLKLEIGTFDMKYLDEDHEWVLVACDADFQECVELSRSSGCNTVRLLVHDLSTNLGSSCESSGEL